MKTPAGRPTVAATAAPKTDAKRKRGNPPSLRPANKQQQAQQQQAQHRHPQPVWLTHLLLPTGPGASSAGRLPAAMRCVAASVAGIRDHRRAGGPLARLPPDHSQVVEELLGSERAAVAAVDSLSTAAAASPAATAAAGAGTGNTQLLFIEDRGCGCGAAASVAAAVTDALLALPHTRAATGHHLLHHRLTRWAWVLSPRTVAALEEALVEQPAAAAAAAATWDAVALGPLFLPVGAGAAAPRALHVHVLAPPATPPAVLAWLEERVRRAGAAWTGVGGGSSLLPAGATASMHHLAATPGATPAAMATRAWLLLLQPAGVLFTAGDGEEAVAAGPWAGLGAALAVEAGRPATVPEGTPALPLRPSLSWRQVRPAAAAALHPAGPVHEVAGGPKRGVGLTAGSAAAAGLQSWAPVPVRPALALLPVATLLQLQTAGSRV